MAGTPDIRWVMPSPPRGRTAPSTPPISNAALTGTDWLSAWTLPTRAGHSIPLAARRARSPISAILPNMNSTASRSPPCPTHATANGRASSTSARNSRWMAAASPYRLASRAAGATKAIILRPNIGKMRTWRWPMWSAARPIASPTYRPSPASPARAPSSMPTAQTSNSTHLTRCWIPASKIIRSARTSEPPICWAGGTAALCVWSAACVTNIQRMTFAPTRWPRSTKTARCPTVRPRPKTRSWSNQTVSTVAMATGCPAWPSGGSRSKIWSCAQQPTRAWCGPNCPSWPRASASRKATLASAKGRSATPN